MIVELLVLASSAGAQCPPASEADVRQEFNAWAAAYQTHDLAGTMAIFAPEIRFEFQGAPDASWSDLKQSYAQEFARPGGAIWVPHWDEIRVSGRIAAAFSLWRGFV